MDLRLEGGVIMQEPTHHVPTAKEIMTRRVVSVSPSLCIFEAIGLLLKNGISGAPVVDENGDLIGMLSELDCLRMLASDDFFDDDHADAASVGDFMTRDGQTIGREMDIFAIAQKFLDHAVRRLPVVEGRHLLGQISRRDVLRGMETMKKARVPRKHYPDYREPA
jgi:CBS domain-containing protein